MPLTPYRPSEETQSQQVPDVRTGLRAWTPSPSASKPGKPAHPGSRARWAKSGLSRLSPGLVFALASLVLGLTWAATVRPLDAPDEIAHLEAIMQVCKEYRLPEVHFYSGPGGQEITGSVGDTAVQAYARGQHQTDAYRLLPYESSQPPLFYLAAGLPCMVTNKDPQLVLYIGRVVAVLFGAGAVYFIWAAAMQVAPRSPMWAAGAASAVAILPQFCFNNATSANDSAANFGAALAFYLWFRGLPDPAFDRWMFAAGGAVGLALLGKLTALALLPGLAVVILFRTFSGGREEGRDRVEKGLRMVFGSSVGFLGVCGWWLVRNILVYGEPSGSQEAFRFYTGKFVILNPAVAQSRQDFLRSTWESTWGRFGWMDISLPQELYSNSGLLAMAALGLSALAAVVFGIARLAQRRGLPTYSWQAWVVMSVVAAVLAASYLRFNLTVAMQAQGRYLFLLLLPASLLFTGGLYALPPGRVLKTIALAVPLLFLAYLNLAGLALVSIRR